jgi:sugar phosphate isomerase/epimerase
MSVEISLITDEISADPETAIELGVEWGVHSFEMRGYYTDRVPRFTSYQKDRLRQTLDHYQSRIIALSPGLFKFSLTGERWESFPVEVIDAEIHRNWKSAYDRAQEHLNHLLPESIEFAKEVGASIINCFSFHRENRPSGATPDIVLDTLRQAAEIAAASNLTLAIEVEAGFWGDSGRNTAQIIELVNHPNLRINWDPCNVFEAGYVPYPDEYTYVREKIAHVHFKDAKRHSNGQFDYLIHGDVDWTGQIQALTTDGYSGFISVETHMGKKVESSYKALNRLRKLLITKK